MIPGEVFECAEHIYRLTDEIERHRAAMKAAAADRAKYVRILHDFGLGYGGIAKLLGISRARAQQLAAPLNDPGETNVPRPGTV